MPDIDKILEAEKNVQDIVTELKQMKNAADLLSSSQKQIDVVLSSAQKVIETTSRFVGECGIIINSLSKVDFNEKLDGLQKLYQELTVEVRGLKTSMESTEKVLKTDLQTAKDQILTEEKQTQSVVDEVKKNLSDKLWDIDEKIKRVIMPILILICLLLIVLLFVVKKWY